MLCTLVEGCICQETAEPFLSLHRGDIWSGVISVASPHAVSYLDWSICTYSVFKEVSSIQSLSHVWLLGTPGTTVPQMPCSSSTPRACSNPCPLSRWCHPTISSPVIPFSSRLWSFPASGSFQISHFFASGSQSIGVSASVLLMNIQDWSPLGWPLGSPLGWLDLLAVQGTLKSLLQHHSSKASILWLIYSSSHIHSWLLEKP